MLFFVVETFRDLDAVGTRFREHGRMMPDGLIYHDSWMEATGERCFQVMEAPDRQLLDEWMSNWQDLVDFEVTEVKSSSDFWGSRSQVTTVFDLVMQYPIGKMRANLTEALRSAVSDAS